MVWCGIVRYGAVHITVSLHLGSESSCVRRESLQRCWLCRVESGHRRTALGCACEVYTTVSVLMYTAVSVLMYTTVSVLSFTVVSVLMTVFSLR